MMKQMQPGEIDERSSQSEKKQSSLLSIKQLDPEVTHDEEPMKPVVNLSGGGVTKSKNTLSISILNSDGLSFDLAKEYEKQNQRIEESKLLESTISHPEPSVQSQIEVLQS